MSGYQIISTESRGRGLFATKQFNKGETILEENPLVSCQFSWNSTYGYLACENCLKPLETAETNVRRLTNDPTIILPNPEFCKIEQSLSEHTRCGNCGVLYCSENCLNEAFNKYHQTLCLGDRINDLEHPLNKLTDAWKKMHYPPETCSILLLQKLFAMLKQSENRAELIGKLEEFQSISVNEDLMIFHKLLGESFSEQLKVLFSLTKEAFDLREFLNLEKFKSLFALIGTNGQGIGTSSLAIWVHNITDSSNSNIVDMEKVDPFIDDLYSKIDEVVGPFLNNEGSALYLNQSKINHSCRPNAEVTFPHSNHTLAVVAEEVINVGDEIFISYLDECNLNRSRHSRQKVLMENYLFVCNCPKCEEELNQPDVTSDEEEEEDGDDEMDDS